MKKIRDFLQNIDFNDIISGFCKSIIACFVAFTLICLFRASGALYRISAGNSTYYVNAYELGADNSYIMFTDVYGFDIIIYGDFDIKTIHKQ